MGVNSFATGPQIDPDNKNLLLFFVTKKKSCGRETGFCKVSDVRNWIDGVLKRKRARYCHFGLDAGR